MTKKLNKLILSAMVISASGVMAKEKVSYSGLYYDTNSNQYFINNKASFTLRSKDNDKYLDKIQYSINNDSYSDYSGKLNFDKEGFHLVRFRAVDPVLNWSPVESFRIYVDLSSPKTFVEFKGEKHFANGKTFISKDTAVSLSSYDNLSGVSKIIWKYKEQDKLFEYSKPQTFSKAGEHIVQYASIDNVGNTEAWRDLTFHVDTKAPTSEALVKGNSHVVGDKMFLDKGSFITLDAKDDEAGVKAIEYRLNNGPILTFKENISVEDLVTTLTYRAVDYVGNAEPWKNITVHLDAAPPVLAARNIGNVRKVSGRYYATPGFKVQVGLKDNESGEKLLITNNEKPEEVTAKEFTFDKPGSYEFTVRGEDQVGNVSNTISYSIVIDNQHPVSEMKPLRPLVKKDDVYLSSLPNKLEFSAKDDQVGIDYIEASFDGKNFFKVEGGIDLAEWKTNERTIYWRAVDQLGNREELKSQIVHVRNRGPLVDLYVETQGMDPVPVANIKPSQREFKRDVANENKPTPKKRQSKKRKTKR